MVKQRGTPKLKRYPSITWLIAEPNAAGESRLTAHIAPLLVGIQIGMIDRPPRTKDNKPPKVPAAFALRKNGVSMKPNDTCKRTFR